MINKLCGNSQQQLVVQDRGGIVVYDIVAGMLQGAPKSHQLVVGMLQCDV